MANDENQTFSSANINCGYLIVIALVLMGVLRIGFLKTASLNVTVNAKRHNEK